MARKRKRPRKRIRSRRLARYRKLTRKQSRAWEKAFRSHGKKRRRRRRSHTRAYHSTKSSRFTTRHYKIAKGLTRKVALKRVRRLDHRDFRGFSYDPKTGKAAIT